MSPTTYKIRQWPGEVIPFDGNLEVVTCPSCEIVYAIPQELGRRMRYWNAAEHPRNTVNTCCPNGHQWHKVGPTVTEADRLRAQLQNERDALTATQDMLNRAAADRDHAQAQARGFKGALAKTNKRIRAGVCPHCRRNFPALGQHIRSEHPDHATVELTSETDPR